MRKHFDDNKNGYSSSPVPGKSPKLTDFAGVLFQDQNLIDGFFLGPNGGGDINLTGP